MSIHGSISALREIRDSLLEGPNLQAAVDTALSVAASVVPVDALLFGRVNPRTAQAHFLACTGGGPAEPLAPSLLADHLARRLAKDGPPGPGRRHVVPLPSRLAASAFGTGTAGATALVLGGRAGYLDVLAAKDDSLEKEAGEFLSAALMLLQLFVDRDQHRREASDLHRQIRRAKNEWEATVDALPQLVCLLNDDGTVVRVNRALETWLLGRVRTVSGTRFTAHLDRLGVLRDIYRALDGDDHRLPDDDADQSASSEDVHSRVWQQLIAKLQDGPVTFTSLKGSGGGFFDLTVQTFRRSDESGSCVRQQVAILMNVTERLSSRTLPLAAAMPHTGH